jgi:hypothetical protein
MVDISMGSMEHKEGTLRVHEELLEKTKLDSFGGLITFST